MSLCQASEQESVEVFASEGKKPHAISLKSKKIRMMFGYEEEEKPKDWLLVKCHSQVGKTGELSSTCEKLLESFSQKALFICNGRKLVPYPSQAI